MIMLAAFLAAGIASSPGKDSLLVLKTDVGDIGVKLDWQEAPLTALKFSRLARSGALDGVEFFRLQDGFVLQTAEARYKSTRPTPVQLKEFVKTPLENQRARHTVGALSLAHPDSDPNGGESSFSIMLVNAPHLDGKYTVFGRVVAGSPTIEALRRLRVTQDYRPVRPVMIRRVFELPAAEASVYAWEGPPRAEQRDGWPFEALALLSGMSGACWLAWNSGRARLAQTLAALGTLAGTLILIGGFLSGAAANPLRGLAIFTALLAAIRLLARYEPPASDP